MTGFDFIKMMVDFAKEYPAAEVTEVYVWKNKVEIYYTLPGYGPFKATKDIAFYDIYAQMFEKNN